jgi:hypothetical protein
MGPQRALQMPPAACEKQRIERPDRGQTGAGQSSPSPEICGTQQNGVHSDILALPVAAHCIIGCGK